MQIQVKPAPITVASSRRFIELDRDQLAYPEVQRHIRSKLATLETLSKHVEQPSRSHVITEAVRNIFCEAAPESRKIKRQCWISAATIHAIELRDHTYKRSRNLGRGIKRCLEAATKFNASSRLKQSG